jgi:hydroxyacylglutathione hydrolase
VLQQNQSVMKALDIQDFKALMADETVVLIDTRPAEMFSEQFIPGSISIGLEGRFSEWSIAFFPPDQKIILIIYPGDEAVAYESLQKLGFNNVFGHLNGGFDTWVSAGESIDLLINIEPDELAMDIPFDDNLIIIDVRKEVEFNEGHIDIAQHMPLVEMSDPGTFATLEEHMNVYVYSQHGYRSVIAASLMKRQGLHNIRNVAGGMEDILKEKRIQITQEKSGLN